MGPMGKTNPFFSVGERTMKGRCAAVAAGLELWDQFLHQKHKTDGVGHSDWGGAYHMWLTDWLRLDHFVCVLAQSTNSLI
ncbi:hypothetical protein Ddc_00368 [Ditylenchus destructor]|nr:hypothetical protein Ddc_00368 [Ditylenchus destructor]